MGGRAVEDQDITRADILPYWNAAVYGTCLYVLGFGIIKPLIITVVVFVCMALHYGHRWITRGGFVMLALTVLLWLGVIRPPDQWRIIAGGIMGVLRLS